MTKQEFINKYKHEFGGYVFDAMSLDSKGALLSMSIRLIQTKIDTTLERAWNDLQPIQPKGVKT